MAKYHPHGDLALYETLVRMAQDFSLRYPLVDGQGNFGSVDGDLPHGRCATPRREWRRSPTRCSRTSKETVDFVDNYDGRLRQPTVLPSRLPNSARQRLIRHCGGHGHEHPAAQPERGMSRDQRAHRQPGADGR